MIGAALLARDVPTGSPTGAIEARPCVSGRLVVCPTPIGNLEDVTLRVLAALREADVVACEDTRHTRVLLERYGVQATLVSYHEHNERERAAELVERMRDGAVVALVSRRGHAAGLRSRLRARRRAASPRGWRSRCCPARRRRSPRWWRAGCRPTRGASPGFLPRKRGALEAVLARAGDASWRSSRRAASARRWRCWPSSIPSGRSRSAAS